MCVDADLDDKNINNTVLVAYVSLRTHHLAHTDLLERTLYVQYILVRNLQLFSTVHHHQCVYRSIRSSTMKQT